MRDINHLRCRVVSLLAYSPTTGLFHWRVDRGRNIKHGDIAGGLNGGYIEITIDGYAYKAHRLAWLYCYGYVPLVELDHMDGDKTNNRLFNLRLCLDSNGGRVLNGKNRHGPQSNNKTGFLGVVEIDGRFRASEI